ncbi:MAG: 4-(cytidine 5'-diphospho)-2-C-methyl-D-erythritol kinase [Pseudorhodobacter sp.]|nr:4-(cytidine 5'-diphospho)-2-C-methyl-D-erythritol kinase [Pseudorhodobacter sp.]
MATEFAPAKINLALHVTAQRGDGYHLLDSLAVFADVGDRITVAANDTLSLAITGPMAAGLTPGDDNLVVRAARAFGVAPGAAISLEKNLPLAAGIGGGSADAAATLRALARLWQRPLPDAAAVLALGADVPVCLAGRAARMTGIGAGLVPVGLPAAWLVLVNPGVALPTAAVFAALARRDHAPLPRDLPQFQGLADLAAFLRLARNDLEAPAIRLAPAIAHCKASLASMSGCLLARMSGSGATCFGLFADPLTAHAAARALQAAQPGWWVAAGRMLD